MKRSCNDCVHPDLRMGRLSKQGYKNYAKSSLIVEGCEYFKNTADVVEVGCGKWIHINDKLPEKYMNCLVHYIHSYNSNDGYWAIGMCHYNGKEFLIDKAYQVTHWMPLPKPPERRL